MNHSEYLTNHFLIAMPALADPNFFHTVTYICEHSSAGAMGVVINRPLNINLGEILEHIEVEPSTAQIANQPIYLGGPVQHERVFILHQPLWQGEFTLPVNDTIGITSSRDILAAIGRGEFKGQSLVALGYAGWAAGQLEEEMANNAWLSGKADARVMFETPNEARWEVAAALLGIDLNRLSGDVGHA